MKKYLKIITLFLIVALQAFSLFAIGEKDIGTSGGKFLKVGAAGSQFLKIGVGARANGMAGAYSSIANDLTSIHWNPAGLADIKTISGNFSFTQWFAGFSHSFAAMSLPVGPNYTAAVHLISFSSDRIPVTTLERADGTGAYYTISDISIGASFSGYLTEQFSFGITAKYISNGFASLTSSGIAFDIGTMYETGIQGIKLGFSIHNLGSEQEYTGQDLKTTKKLVDELYASPLDAAYLSSPFSIPLMFRAGVSSDIINIEDHKLVAALDFVTLSDTPEEFAVGAEYTWHDLLSIRGGYLFGQDQFGLAGGIGINYLGGGFKGQVDYSINPTKDIGLVNRITISMALD